MDGFGLVGIGIFALTFGALALVAAGGVLTSARGRTWEGRLLAACAILAAIAFPVVVWIYLGG